MMNGDWADRGVRVAVVDDDAAVRDSLAAVLDAAGHEVDAFESGDQFLARGLSPAPDCILLDVNLPGRDGWEVVSALYDQGVGSAIILVTGRGASRTPGDGVFAVLDKPVRPAVLLETIQQALRAR